MPPDFDDARIRRYLLGSLPEPEAEALEEAYLADPDVLERVRGVEDDLLDDYAAGRLAPSEMAPFESRYLTSSPRRDRVAAARALRLAHVPVTPSRRSWGTRRTVPLAIAASLLLALAALSLWSPRAPDRASAPPVSVARPEARSSPMTSPQVAPQATRFAFALSPVLLRGRSEPPELRIPSAVSTVALEMEGDPSALTADTVEASIRSVEGRHVWSGRAQRIANPSRPALIASVDVPAGLLTPGDYLVTLSAGGGTVHRYVLYVRSSP